MGTMFRLCTAHTCDIKTSELLTFTCIGAHTCKIHILQNTVLRVYNFDGLEACHKAAEGAASEDKGKHPVALAVPVHQPVAHHVG
jgi:hypothetical protein